MTLTTHPTRSWLVARAQAAKEMFANMELDLSEMDRAIEDAISGRYSGPLRLANGRVSNDENFLNPQAQRKTK